MQVRVLPGAQIHYPALMTRASKRRARAAMAAQAQRLKLNWMSGGVGIPRMQVRALPGVYTLHRAHDASKLICAERPAEAAILQKQCEINHFLFPLIRVCEPR